MFEMINSRVESMSLTTVTNWMTEFTDKLEVINSELEQTDVYDVNRMMYYLEQQNDLELCLEVLDERLNTLLDERLDMVDMLSSFNDDYVY